MKPKLPIIIRESEDLGVFETLKSAELKLEPIDVLNGEFVGYDAEGRLLNIEVLEENRSTMLGLSKEPIKVTKIFCREEEPSHQKELYKHLVIYLKKIDEPLSSKETIEELVGKLINRIGYEI